MEREDPLERLERQEQERKQNGSLNKTITILGVVAGVLFVALIVVFWQKSSLVNELRDEKDDLTEQIVAL